MRLWFRRGRRGPGDGRAAHNPPAGVAATAPEPNRAPAEDPVGDPEPTPVPAADPVDPPAAAVTEAKSARRSKHAKKAARAAGSPSADPFDRALDRLRTEIPATEEDGFR